MFLNNPFFLEWNIHLLPQHLQRYLYIWCMKLFWRYYIPLTAKIPTWYDSHIQQQTLLLNARLHNIHFLHLPCNTLEENKKYIIGCQCSYCKGNNHLIKTNNFIRYIDIYFNSHIPYTESHWNNLYEYIKYIKYNNINITDELGNIINIIDIGTYTKGMSIFNPSFGFLT